MTPYSVMGRCPYKVQDRWDRLAYGCGSGWDAKKVTRRALRKAKRQQVKSLIANEIRNL